VRRAWRSWHNEERYKVRRDWGRLHNEERYKVRRDWRRWHNEECYKVRGDWRRWYKGKVHDLWYYLVNMIRVIKERRLRWALLVGFMG
jgi:hypothetical protein